MTEQSFFGNTLIDLWDDTEILRAPQSVWELPTARRWNEAERMFGTSLEPLSRGQKQTQKAAMSEIHRQFRGLQQMGLEEEYREYEERGGETWFGSHLLGKIFSTVGTPLSTYLDYVNIGNYTVAGFAHELLRTGSASQAFEQAAREFGDALPFVSVQGAKQTTFANVLEELDPELHPAAAIGLGLGLDILLDPFTYTGKLLFSGPAKVAKLFARAKPIKKGLGVLGDFASNSRAAGILRKGFINHYQLQGLAPHKEIVAKGDKTLQHAWEATIQSSRYAQDELAYSISQDIHAIFAPLGKDYNASLVIGWLAEDKDKFGKTLTELAAAGVFNPEKVETMKSVYTNMSRFLKKLGKDEVSLGILSEESLRRNYFMHVAPQGGVPKAISDALGLQQGKFSPKYVDWLTKELKGSKPGITTEEIAEHVKYLEGLKHRKGYHMADPNVSKELYYENLVDRVGAGVPTDIIAQSVVATRGYAHVKRVVSDSLHRSVFNNPEISRQVTATIDVVSKKGTKTKPIWEVRSEYKKLQGQLSMEGYGIVEMKGYDKWYDLTDLAAEATQEGRDYIAKMLKKQDGWVKTHTRMQAKGQASKIPGYTAPRIKGAYVVPMAIKERLDKMDKFTSMSADSGASEFFQVYEEYMNLWKGYALFAPGYHARNLVSELFYNWIGGVGSNYGRLKRGEFPAPFGFMKAHALAFKAQVGLEGSQHLPDVVKKTLKKFGYDPNLKTTMLRTAPNEAEIKAAKAAGKAVPEFIERNLNEVVHGLIERGAVHTTPVGMEAMWNPTTQMMDEYGAFKRASTLLSGRVKKEGLDWDQIQSLSDETLKKALSVEYKQGALSKWKEVFGREGTALRANRAMASMVDNNTRLAQGLDAVIKGETLDNAAKLVRHWHYMPGKMTDFENKILRNIIPFYSWMKFNTPLMLETMMSSGSKYARVEKIRNALEHSKGDLREGETPDYFDEQFAIALPIMRNQKPLFLTPDLPFVDLNRRNYKSVMTSLNPLAGLFYEGVSGHMLFTGAAIEDYPGEMSAEIPFLTKRLQNLLETFVPPVRRLGTAPVRAWQRGEFAEWAVSETTGIKTRAVDVPRVLRGQTYRRRELLRNYYKMLEEGQK